MFKFRNFKPKFSLYHNKFLNNFFENELTTALKYVNILGHMGVWLSWLEHLPCKQGVMSSNLIISTKKSMHMFCMLFLCKKINQIQNKKRWWHNFHYLFVFSIFQILKAFLVSSQLFLFFCFFRIFWNFHSLCTNRSNNLFCSSLRIHFGNTSFFQAQINNVENICCHKQKN